MTDDTKENIYSPQEVARLLEISESTLRKYSLLLEKTGYVFDKNTRGQRGYFDSDIIALRRLIDLKDGDMTLERASYVVYTAWAKSNRSLDDMDTQRYDKQEMDDLKEMIGALSSQLNKQQAYIDDRLNKHDELLMESLRESLETKKLIATTEEKKGFFSKLFKR